MAGRVRVPPRTGRQYRHRHGWLHAMGRRQTTGGVKPAGDRIEVRFSWRGRELRPTLALKPTAANLRHARRLRDEIQDEIQAGTFTLERYFPDYRFSHRHEAPSEARGRTFGDWVDVWGKLASRELEYSTHRIYLRTVTAYWLPGWRDLPPAAITHEKILVRLAELSEARFDEASGRTLVGLSRKSQNNILIPLRAVFRLICRALPALPNPTEGVDNLRVQRSDPDPFSPDEVETILAKIRETSEVLADYFEFACFAGLRVSEQIALLWSDVDLRSGTILVRRARVMTKDKDRTKTNVARTVELNDRAAAVLERQRARTQMAGPQVFRNPATGRPWNDEQEQRRDWTRFLVLCGVRHRPPKECRDTSVTLALMAGANPMWVARQHGHSMTVMMRDYAKWIPSADRGENRALVNRSIGAAAAARKAAG